MHTCDIHLTVEIPSFGDSIVVQEGVSVVTGKLRVARHDENPTIKVKAISGKEVAIPIHLIGPIVERR